MAAEMGVPESETRTASMEAVEPVVSSRMAGAEESWSTGVPAAGAADAAVVVAAAVSVGVLGVTATVAAAAAAGTDKSMAVAVTLSAAV
jgi:hypothetical protein